MKTGSSAEKKPAVNYSSTGARSPRKLHPKPRCPELFRHDFCDFVDRCVRGGCASASAPHTVVENDRHFNVSGHASGPESYRRHSDDDCGWKERPAGSRAPDFRPPYSRAVVCSIPHPSGADCGPSPCFGTIPLSGVRAEPFSDGYLLWRSGGALGGDRLDRLRVPKDAPAE